MIRPPHIKGAAFSEAKEGDVRNNRDARLALSKSLGVTPEWAYVQQIHGSDVVRAFAAGETAQADALWTTEVGLPLAIFTADCFGVVLRSESAVGVAHAGWRGVVAGVVAGLASAMTEGGHAPLMAAVGPGIRSCCFEVGSDVAQRFDGHATTTSWGSESVDLEGALKEQMTGLEVYFAERCTRHDSGLFSHRRTGARDRLAALGWVE